MPRVIKAPRGSNISCQGWVQEAIMRMLMNNLDPEVAEDPSQLVIYGGQGRVVRNWDAYDKIIDALQQLKGNETLVIQSGKPVAVFPTHSHAPRVIMSTAMMVPAWASWKRFRELEKKGLTMYGQSTAASWSYIGIQGILQGTCDTLSLLAQRFYGGSLQGRLVLTSGLGGMGSAQPPAVTINQGVVIVVEADREQIIGRLRTSVCDMMAEDYSQALGMAREALRKGEPRSIALCGNAAEVYPRFVEEGVIPDIVTDQTAAHDLLYGYIPAGLSLEEASDLRQSNPDDYIERSLTSIASQVRAMLAMQEEGAIVFDYGNNIRRQAARRGVEDAFSIPGFIKAFIRPLFCEGKGPFRWVAVSGNPQDIYRTDEVLLREFRDSALEKWINFVQKDIQFQGLPARLCWLDHEQRPYFGCLLNRMVREGELGGPVVITRDHLDSGSVAAPFRETEGMKDGSDAIADWPILNAMLNISAGAHFVNLHHGGGVGIGQSIHAGMSVVADGSKEAEEKIKRVLKVDPGIGIVRHADAGYSRAEEVLRGKDYWIP